MYRLIAFVVLLSSCTHMRSVTFDAAIGHEDRPGSRRNSTQAGLSVGIGRAKLKGSYRFRITDGQFDQPEHGVFVGASVPIWRKR